MKVVPRDSAEQERLLQKARLAVRLSHPSIATVYAVEQHEHCALIVSELVEGKRLDAALRDGSLSDYDIVRVGRDVAVALADAHQSGILHHDLRPGNIMVSGGSVKILDLGIAPQNPDGKNQPAYVSPEQAMGREVDERSDIFSLGVVLYEALGRDHPFPGSTPQERVERICTEQPRELGELRPELPRQLVAAIHRCLETRRERRFVAVGQLAAELQLALPRLSRAPLPITPTVADSVDPKNVLTKRERPERILVVDDDVSILRLMVALAKRQGIECDSAANGPEAIALLEERSYGVTFLDLMMPRIDGWGVLDYLRGQGSGSAGMLFIVTAFPDQKVSAADSEIVTGVIYKPVDADEIQNLMRTAVRGVPPRGILQKTRHQLLLDDDAV